MTFYGFLFISFLMICDVQFNHLSNDVHLDNSISEINLPWFQDLQIHHSF